MDDNSYKVIDVDINEILPNRFQPRIQFDEEEILELSDSIKEHGVIQPLVVRTIGDKYEIIAGERRYKASVLAGKETVPVIIKNLNDKDSAEIALIENIQRKNLTPIEEAISYKKILDMGYLTQETLATKLGKSQSSVANKIRLLNLSDEVQEALLDNKISERHARSLLRLKSLTEQNKMLDKILNNRLTVRKTDEEIDKLINDKEIIKEEKGELNMNNEMNQISNNQVSNIPSFDIFGAPQPTAAPTSTPVMEVPSAPVVEPITPVVEAPAMPTLGGIEFDAAGNVIAAPTSTPVMEVPSASAVESDAQIMPEIAPVIETPVMPSAPVEAPTMPTLGGIEFDAAGNVIAAPTSTPVMEVPTTSPIIDTTINNNENLSNLEYDNSNINSIVSEPIIVTDYSKQYDPIMPGTTVDIPEKVDFKEIISAIRECSQKIEKYGYKIDVEEYDLSTLYQVVFKVEK